MSNLLSIPDTELGSAPMLAETTGQLNLSPQVKDGFNNVRLMVHDLNALLHQVMRKVALPKCRDIGEELLRVHDSIPKENLAVLATAVSSMTTLN